MPSEEPHSAASPSNFYKNSSELKTEGYVQAF